MKQFTLFWKNGSVTFMQVLENERFEKALTRNYGKDANKNVYFYAEGNCPNKYVYNEKFQRWDRKGFNMKNIIKGK